MEELIISLLRESAELKLRFAKESVKEIVKATEIILESLGSGGKVLIFGNGGSAADAQHIASEFVNRLLNDRGALSAIALTTDGSILTSIGNDSSFNNIFSRQIEALANRGDVAWAISTSGRSKNVIKGIETAGSLGLKTIAFIGGNKKNGSAKIDCIIHAPSKSTPRIQELQITVAHIICELVEAKLPKTKELP